MTLNLTNPQSGDLKPRITVFGVGGAGGNAVNNMIEKQLDGVEFVVANTDAQALAQNQATARIQLGVKVTEGLGAGARPSVGAAAAEESIEDIVDHLAGANMCFITAGMGGGTGTGAAPIIAQAARELGVLTVGVVTKPFQFEGAKRMRQAEQGVETLQQMVDTLIIIPNQNLFRIANEKTTFTEAFSMADDVLYQGVKGVTDLMVRPGLINLDFADIRSVMDEMGKAMMGTGEADGENRAIHAAEKAIANPLLDEISLKGAKGVLINITGGPDMTLFEYDEAANRIREEVDPDANIIVGSALDPEMAGRMRVSVVATGIDAAAYQEDVPRPRRLTAEPVSRQQVAQPEPEPEVEPEPEIEAPAAEIAQFDDAAQSRPAANAGRYEVAETAYLQAAEPEATLFDSAPAAHVAATASPAPRGTPSPEILARLHAAVRNVPDAIDEAPGRRRPDPRADARTDARTDSRGGYGDPRGEPGGDRKYGFNALINRMSGQGGEASERAQPALRRPPPVQAEADRPAPPEEDERIEIPAFLRRQAN